MEYRVDDRELRASVFLGLVQEVWPGEYDAERMEEALAKTVNMTAYEDGRLVGVLRILSDGYFSPRATSQADMLACPFGNCREGLIP